MGEFTIEQVNQIRKLNGQKLITQEEFINGEKSREKTKQAIEKADNKIIVDRFEEGITYFQNYLDLAKRFSKIQSFYYDKDKKWRMWNYEELKYDLIDETDMLNRIDKALNGTHHTTSSKIKGEILESLRRIGRKNIPLELNDFKIQIGKKIYDIRNDEVLEANPKHKTKIFINHDISNIKDNDKCEKIDKLFKDWLGEEKETLYDVISFIMSPKYFLDICFWLVGVGDNGKGLFQQIIAIVLGVENITSQDLELLSDPKDRFTKGFLKNKLLCSLGDGNYQVIRHTKAIKTLSGCTDIIRCEIKGGGQEDFYNTAKVLGAYNTLPETIDKTKGFYRRQHITEFKNSFTGLKNPLPSINEEEYKVLTYKCFKRLQQIYKENNLKGWGNLQERQDKYERLSNPIGLFLNEEMIDDDEYCAFGKTLYKHYSQFALKNGYNKFKYDVFEARLINQGYEKKRKDVYHSQGYCWGKEKHIPKDLINDIPRDKFQVFSSLKFKNIPKIDRIDEIDIGLVVDTPIKNTNTKRVSKVSILSISDDTRDTSKELLDFYKLKDELENYEEFTTTRLILDLKEKYNFNDNQFDSYISKLLKEGLIGKFGKDLYRKL